MDIVKKLTNEFSRQDFTNSREDLDAGELDKYKELLRDMPQLKTPLLY